jgi:hypothetical protein
MLVMRNINANNVNKERKKQNRRHYNTDNN